VSKAASGDKKRYLMLIVSGPAVELLADGVEETLGVFK
jgi:hypothetical protein